MASTPSHDNDALHFQLTRPLLIMRAPKGFISCGYISMEACNRIGDACAIMAKVDTLDDLLTAKVQAVSDKAAQLGIVIGETGESALNKLR
ncbi:YunC family protein [Achromobacter aloeverae]|uniref:DUF1805 domain-containing protein n=1 Tax=Achromobacter aloeverae TaxID=1750518 RepID=A0A4Q1HRZ6_9BURK|nr:DUF1805 domain-containing protein [Achromobacter aloeverae]RXN93303.1 DUF1805 domain-containing protein [Achromobacter aloeverae]